MEGRRHGLCSVSAAQSARRVRDTETSHKKAEERRMTTKGQAAKEAAEDEDRRLQAAKEVAQAEERRITAEMLVDKERIELEKANQLAWSYLKNMHS